MAGDPDELFAQAYETLRAIARRLLSNRGGTLQPTAVVHEAWLKVSQARQPFVDQAHFTAVAVRALRQVLIDHARARLASKRGGARERLTLDALPPISDASYELLVVEQLLTRLQALDERQARVAELRIYGGLELQEIAGLLQVSLSTVEREWRRARAWLAAHLTGGEAP